MNRYKFLSIFFLIVTSFGLYAQPGGDPAPIPIDGGILYLLAAGGAYGMKKIVDHKRKKKNE